MSDPLPPLLVPLDLPQAPHLLATPGFLSTLATVEAQITALVVKDAQSAQQAADLQIRLTSAASALEKQRKALKQPFIDAGRKIDEVAAEPARRIEDAKSSVKRLLTAYDQERQRLAAETERLKQAELRRLREQQEAEEREAKRKADVLAAQMSPLTKMPENVLMGVAAYNPEQIVLTSRKVGNYFAPIIAASDTTPMAEGPALFLTESEAEAHAKLMLTAVRNYGKPAVPVMELDDEEPAVVEKTETEKQIEAIQHAPVVVAPKPVGIAYRTTLVATVVDAAKLPDVFVERVPKLAAIRAVYCTKWQEGQPMPVCEGVTFTIDKQPVSTGRAKF